ncbi:ABC transporter permease [Hirschia baltica]|uniref:ABC-2 type transporter n=1 Tax=Hirschia baltica (strain ATCC 49814 / DSM 5838 / IFAM 1418) TaxID=582402 RepID=C6XS45_HIRBI|nr:ABC transporter permease [Hirschia baltica]ACT60886.1 ABC-2 type transporter [Hirschia baltica ATCC 49814]
MKKTPELIPDTDSANNASQLISETLLSIKASYLAIFQNWRVWWILARQDIQMRYRRSAIGPFWISISMAIMIFGIAFLYSQIFDIDFKSYLAFLGASFLIWGYLSLALSEATGILIESEQHLRSVPIRTSVFSARMVFRNVIIFCHNWLVISCVLFYTGVPITPALLLMPFGFILLILFGFFCGMFLGPITLRFRDVGQTTANFVQFAFFLTPVIWMPSQGRLDSIWLLINPFYHLMEVVRQPLLGKYPTADNWIYACLTVLGVAILANITDVVSRKKIFLWL